MGAAMSGSHSGYQFPKNCPEEDCPKPGAAPVDQRVWRLVKNDPPIERDFQNHVERGKRRDSDACLRCGLSVMNTEESARHLQEMMSFLGKYVASARLTPDRGLIRQTTKRQSHHTWWPDERTPRHHGFEVG